MLLLALDLGLETFRRIWRRERKAVPVHFLEAKHGQRLGEVRRQFGLAVDDLAARSVDPEPARMQMQLAADPAGQHRLGSAIFGIANDRMANRRHVRA